MGRMPCCDKSGLKRGPWTPEEDQKLVDYIQKHGYGNWRTLPKNAGLERCGKSCRLRWTNYLRPDIKRGRFSFEEEETIIHLHSILGNKWSAIAAQLPGRTDNEIKNYWNTHIRKRLLRMGIDPVTHCPRLDLLDLSSILNSYSNSPTQSMGMPTIMGLQSVVKPDLVQLATSLLSTLRQNQCLPMQNQLSSGPHVESRHEQVLGPTQPQFIPLQDGEHQRTSATILPCVTLPVEAASMVPNLAKYQPALFDYDDTGCLGLDYGWQGGGGDALTSEIQQQFSQNTYCDQVNIVGRTSSDNSNLLSNNSSSNHNLSLESVFSTPCSSPSDALFDPNSTIFSNGGMTLATGDEMDTGYSNDLYMLEDPRPFYVNEFM